MPNPVESDAVMSESPKFAKSVRRATIPLRECMLGDEVRVFSANPRSNEDFKRRGTVVQIRENPMQPKNPNISVIFEREEKPVSLGGGMATIIEWSIPRESTVFSKGSTA